MDEFLAEVGLLRLKPVAWQILVYMLGRRHVEPWVSLKIFDRSDDALWRARSDLQKRGWIEPVPDTKLWRITEALRRRLDGQQAAAVTPSAPPPAPPATGKAASPPSFSADAAPPKPPEPRSFSPAIPQAAPAPASFSPVAPPPAEPFLRRSREIQMAALNAWRASRLRQDLLLIVMQRLELPTFVHFDLQEALQTAERWACSLDPCSSST